ncbi:MAG TPA: sigma-54 dependent transcriptional regulator [Vicinamibacterales bacterium]|jgi:two-component system nitrogen regulation response regulator NtrX|nr:sigma-54 dependent transcriptional regulator [Vicinamibacterales bacterium]
MTRKRHIAIVDDEANIGRSLRLILEGEGYRVSVFESIAAFSADRTRAAADVYLLDVRLPDGNGIDLLRSVRQSDDRAVVVMISGHGTVSDAVQATKTGAFDFLEKPLARDRVLLVVKNALEWVDLQRENQRFREMVGEVPKMIGSSPVFQHAVQQATQVARSDVTALLLGESGTGKELLAAHIHRESPFAAGPFVKVNCAAIPTELIESELFGHEKGAFTGAAALRRGKFELADGGTIFLDEVGDLHEASQAKLLRVLQDGELQRVGGEQTIKVSTRVISATNRRLDDLVSDGKFREDLYYRLSVVPIRVPSLRERVQDIAELVPYLLSEFCARNNFRPRIIDPDAIAQLERYSWPGNVRELKNVVERMAILTPGDRITADAIPLEVRAAQTPRVAAGLQEVRDSAERDRIRQALDQTDWNVSAAARLLDTERTALHKRIRTLGLKRQ